MCSFGYVLTDENFNIISEEDILMNPKGKFKLTNRKGQVDLVLKYSEDVFRQQERFPHYYPKIKSLLNDSNTVVVGYSTDNDVKYILSELLYYSLKPINFNYYDIQEVFDDEFDFEKLVSLSDASELLGLSKQNEEHDSLSDAKSTMEICKHICEEKNISVEALLSKYEPRVFKNYRLLNEGDEKIRVISSFRLYKYYIVQPGEKIDYVNSKNFCFSKKLESDNPWRMINLYKLVANAGGIYSAQMSTCDIFISCDDNVDDERYNMISTFNHKTEVIKYSDFLKIMDTSSEELDKMNALENMVKKHIPDPWIEKRIEKLTSKKEKDVSSKNTKRTLSTSLGDMYGDFLSDFIK